MTRTTKTITMCLAAFCVAATAFANPAATRNGNTAAPQTDNGAGTAAQDVSPDLATGRAALSDGLHELAEKKLKAYLSGDNLLPEDKARASLLLAQALHGMGQYEEMLSVLEKHPADLADFHEGRRFWSAAAYYRLNRHEEALKAINGFREKHPTSRYLPQSIRMKAASHLATGNDDEAFKLFSEFAEKYGDTPDGPENLFEWGSALVEAGMNDEAVPILEQLITDDFAYQREVEVRIKLASIYAEKKDLEKAIHTLQPALEKDKTPDPQRFAAAIMLSGFHENENNIEKSLKALENCEALIKDEALKQKLRLRTGQLLLETETPQKGIPFLHEFVSANTADETGRQVQLSLAQTLLDKDFAGEAEREFQNYLETFSDKEGVFRAGMGRGEALFKLGRYGEAADAFSKAYSQTDIPERKEQSLLRSADARFAAAQYEAAFKIYMKTLSDFPDSEFKPQILFQAAESALRSDSPDTAEKLYMNITTDFPDHDLSLESVLRLGMMEEKRGNIENALEIYRELLEKTLPEATEAEVLRRIAPIMYKTARFSEALEIYTKLTSAGSEDKIAEHALYMSGWCRFMLGREDEALETFSGFIAAHPESDLVPDVMFWIAEHNYNLASYEKAEKHFLALAGNHAQSRLADTALFWAGRAALNQKSYRRANDHFSSLIRDYPQSARIPEARYFQSEALSELGEFAGAILALDEIIREFPDSYLVNRAWLRKGDSQYTLGTENPKRYPEAIASYQIVMEKEDASTDERTEARYKTGLCLEKLDRHDEAFERYMEVVYSYFANMEKGVVQNHVWFSRAAFRAAQIKENEKSWRQAAQIYERVAAADVPASRDAQERINRIKRENWLFFY